jgi:hypothetical protein
VTKYDPRKNAEGYNDPTPYAAEKHMMAQIRGKQARVAGGYFENIISASCDYYLSRGLAKIEKTPEPMKPLGAKNRKGQFLACYTKQAQPDYGGTLKGGRSIYFEAKHTDDERIEQRRLTQEQQDDLEAHHKLGSELVLGCSELWAFGIDHPSAGMAAEIELAKAHGIPVRNGFEAISELKPDEEPESGEEDDPNIGSVTIHLPARGGSIHVHLDGATILTLADRLISDPGVHIEIGG